MTYRVGQQLRDYRLLHLLGQGGFAEVYLAEHIHLGSQAAIKILYNRLTESDIDRFRNEARTIARLKHPHIVRIFDFGIEEMLPFLVMDYAPNRTLRERHPKGQPISFALIIDYTLQLAAALQHAHDQQIIHRDIKPENVLLGSQHEILLSDFGIATLAHSSRSQPVQEVAGTASYMAPEQLQGKPCPASDQYALGVVIYEWLAGAPPFQGTFVEIAGQKLFQEPPSMQGRAPFLTPEIEQVVMIALAREPNHRFASVTAFASALKQAWLAASEPTILGPMSLPDQGIVSHLSVPPDQLLQQLRTPILSQVPQSQDEGQSMPTQLLTPQFLVSKQQTVPVFQPNNAGVIRTPGTSSDRSTLPKSHLSSTPSTAFAPDPINASGVSPANMQSKRNRLSRRAALIGLTGLVGAGTISGGIVWWRSQLAHTTGSSSEHAPTPTLPPKPTGSLIQTYKGHTEYIYVVRWSSNGTQIASGGDDKTIQVWDALSGRHIVTYGGHSSYIYGLAWQPAGILLVSGSRDGSAHVWNARNGQQLLVHTNTEKNWVTSADWSQDGKRILLSIDTQSQILDAHSAKPLASYPDPSPQGLQTSVWSPDNKRFACGGSNNLVYLWDASQDTVPADPMLKYSNHTGFIRALAWSPDGKMLASGSFDNTVHVWDATTGQQIHVYAGHTHYVNDVAWSPDGKRIASASSDNTVQIWDATTGQHPYIYRGHQLYVENARWSPDGTMIASGSYDLTVQIWTAR